MAKYFEVTGNINKEETVQALVDYKLKNTFVVNVDQPYPGYHYHKIDARMVEKNTTIFLITKTRETWESIIRATDKINKFLDEPINASFANLSLFNVPHYAIRIIGFRDLDNLETIQKAYQDEGFVVITGAPGTGKTTLAKILLHEMGEKDVVVAHLTTTQLEADDMLRMVTASFGLRYEDLDKAQLLKSLESFLLARSRENKRALLVIDEAQNLPARSLEELRMLSNLQVGDKALVQTFLLGQAQFRTLLDKPELEQLRQRIIANYHLSPLATDESKRYIESRLQQVGWAEDPTFAELAYEKIYEYTEGIPRRINMLCDRVLLYCCMEEIHEITSEVIDMVTNELDQEVSGMPVSAQSAQLSATQMKKKVAQSVAVKSKAAIKKSAPVLDEATQAFDSEDFSKYKKNKKEETDQKTKTKPKKPVEEATQQIMGNTVAQQRPKSSNQDARDTTEIPERDLFRVIPGGKKHEQAPDVSEPNQPMAPAASAKPTPEDVIQRRILRLVLAFHRSPSRFPGLDNPHQPLPEGITELLELAIADDQVLTQVSPAAVMGISPAMLRAAVRFFVRRALFVVDGDDFRVLGLRSTASQADVEKHYDLLMRLLRQDKQRGFLGAH